MSPILLEWDVKPNKRMKHLTESLEQTKCLFVAVSKYTDHTLPEGLIIDHIDTNIECVINLSLPEKKTNL